MNFASRCIIDADGKVVFPGIDYSGAKLTLWKRTREYLVVRISGTSCWAGVAADRAYVPAHFAVYVIVGRPKKNQRYIGVVGEEVPVKQITEFPIARRELRTNDRR